MDRFSERQSNHSSGTSPDSSLEIAQGYRVVICGTARNVSKHLWKAVKSLTDAFSDFAEVKIVICESFSTDKTVDELLRLQGIFPQLTFFSDDSTSATDDRRTVRIASARNELIKRVRADFFDFDLVVMVDLDGVNRDLTRKQVLSVFTFDGWDGVFANQPYRYYDIWALRARGWSEQDCWEEFRTLSESMRASKAKEIAVTNKMKSISKGSPPILVESAFGGLGIYKIRAFLDSEYIGHKRDGSEICEHVAFHETLTRKGYKLYIVPSLVNLNHRSQRLNALKELILRFTGIMRH